MPRKIATRSKGSKRSYRPFLTHPLERIERYITREIRVLFPSVSYQEISIKLDVSPPAIAGDFCLSTYSLAKLLAKDPIPLAVAIGKVLHTHRPPFVRTVRVIGPYINLEVDQAQFSHSLFDYLFRSTRSFQTVRRKKTPKTAIVDCTVPLLIQPLTIDYIRPIIVASLIANMYAAAGYRVVRNHFLSDWSTTTRELFYSLLRWVDRIPRSGTKALHYFHAAHNRYLKEAETHEGVRAEVKLLTRKIENGDSGLFLRWRSWTEVFVRGLQYGYGQLKIYFDLYQLESSFRVQAEKLVADISRRVKGSSLQGSNVIVINSLLNSPPALLQRQDFTKTTLAYKLAASHGLLTKHRPDEIVYVANNETDLMIKQLILLLRAGRYAHRSITLRHLPVASVIPFTGATSKHWNMELVSLLEKLSQVPSFMAKRNGRKRALSAAALVYALARESLDKNIIFDPERISGGFNNYLGLQKLYLSLPKKVGKLAYATHTMTINEFSIIKELALFPSVIQTALQSHAPNILCSYLERLAEQTNRYLERNTGKQGGSYELLLGVKRTIERSMKTLGIEFPKTT